jgi:acyl-CoA thioester hydrolase
MYKHNTQIRVRYGETDQMGYVYYGNYAVYFEVGRVEALRNLGMSYKQLEQQGIMMPVLEHTSRYLQPATYDELLTLVTSVKELPRARITFHYEIYNDADRLIHSGETQLVFLNAGTMRPCRPPEALLSLLRPFF